MKILFFVNKDIVIYNFKKELLSKLIENGNQVVISCPYGEKFPLLENIGCKLISTDIDRRGINPIKDFKLYINYKKIIKQEKPDIVMTLTIKCNIYGGMASKSKRIPYIANITGLGSSFQGGLITNIVTLLYKNAFKGVKKVLFENQENLDIFLSKKIIEQEKSLLVNGAGVNLDEFKFLPLNNNKINNFLFIGRIMKEKGVDEFLYAAIKAKEENINASFNMIGFFEDDYKDLIMDLSDKKIINYYGFQNDVKPFIEKSDCVVLPSYHEGMSNVLLESAAMGRPLIVSNIHGCKETVNDNENGFLVNVKDKIDLFKKIKKFCNLTYDMKKQMGIKSRELMVAKFNRENVTDKTIEIINTVKI